MNRVEAVTKVTVYTNQPEVELFANGVSVGKQNKGEYPFFYFQVENKGETILTAKAGNFTDESKICKVEQFDESYRLKEEGAILNWFEITAPEGYFSINDTIGDIMGTFRGKIFVLKMAKRILGGKKKSSSKKEKTSDGGFKFNGSILEMAKGFTVKRVLSMASVVGGEEMTKEEMLAVNEQLNRIRKKKH